ncbi:MAG: phytanoyl-CoA dioxygenase family protein [Pseudomonadota bacterium]
MKLKRSITTDEVRAYNLNGVVRLKEVLDLRTVNNIRSCIDEAVDTLGNSKNGYDLTAITKAAEAKNAAALKKESQGQHDVGGIIKHIQASGKSYLYDNVKSEKSGSFLLDTAVTTRIKEFRQLAMRGAFPEIAAALLNSEEVNFFGDQVFIKEPGTKERTAFHQDATYFHIEGDQCCVLWIPVDPVTIENGAMMYVRKSHLDGILYQPNVFISQTPLPGSEGNILPDIEGHLEDYDIVHFDVEPGDILVHNYKTVHGTGGNLSRYQVRRAASIRYCGDDIRFKTRPGAPKQLHYTNQLKDGDKLTGPDFPMVWKKPQRIAA